MDYDREKTYNYFKDFLPYVEILHLDGNVKQYDGAVIQCKSAKILSAFELQWEDDLMSSDIAERRAAHLTDMFSLYFNSSYELFFRFKRSIDNTPYPLSRASNMPHAVSSLERARAESFSNNVFFRNELVLYIVYTPPKFGNKIMLTDEAIEDYCYVLNLVSNYLPQCGLTPTLLYNDDLITSLYCYISTKREKFTLPAEDINVGIAKSIDIYPSTTPLIMDDYLVQTWTFKTLPYYSYKGIFDQLTNFQYPLIVYFRLGMRSKEETKAALLKKRDQYSTAMFSARTLLRSNSNDLTSDDMDVSSLLGKQGCEQALMHATNDNVTALDLCITISTSYYQNSEKMFDKVHNALIEISSGLGIVLVREKRNNTLAFFSTFPGSSCYYDKQLVLADNVADMITDRTSANNRRSEHLEEITHSSIPHLLGRKTQDNSICNMSLSGEHSNSGHTFITGATGAGKSVFLALLGSQWLKYENTKVVYIDMGLSCLNFVQGNGGTMFYPMGDTTTFCPFKDAQKNLSQVMSFLESICVANNVQFTPELRNLCRDVIEKIEPGKETTSLFYSMLKGMENDKVLTTVMQQYVDIYGGLFNAKDDAFTHLSRVVGIEMEKMLTNQSDTIVFPTLVYVLNRLEDAFIPEEPTLLILDEAWRFLSHPFFATYIQKWLKLLRKKNVFVVIATQELNDLIKSPLTNTIIENCTTQIFMSNPKANNELVRKNYKALGLEDYEIDLIRDMYRWDNIVLQEGRKEIVNWMVDQTSLGYLVTTDEMKRNYRNSHDTAD